MCPITRRIPLTMVGLLFLSVAASGAEQRPELQWHRDLEQAWQITQSTRRPMVLFVKSEHCIHCLRMQSNTLTDRGVRHDLNNFFVPAMADMASEPELIERLGIRSFPTILIIGPDARVLDTVIGYADPRQLRHRLMAAQPPKLTQR